MGRLTLSFDLDGTLVDYTFVNSIWFEAIPKMYAERNHISLDEALAYARSEYDKIGDERMEWYDLRYWLDRFGLECEPRRLLDEYRGRVRVYEEVPEALRILKEEFELVINSNCPRDFMDIELAESGILGYFKYVFSSVSDFRIIKKTPQYYRMVCNLIGVEPRRLVHVGDNWRFDYLVPRRIGVRSIYLDRSREKNGENVIHSLAHLPRLLRRFQNP